MQHGIPFGVARRFPEGESLLRETFAERFRGVRGHPFEFGFDLRLAADKLLIPFAGRRRNAFS